MRTLASVIVALALLPCLVLACESQAGKGGTGGKCEAPAEQSKSAAGERPAPAPLSASEDRFGVRIERVAVTALGRMLDLRFTVIDAKKAAAILSKDAKAALIDETTKKEMTVAVGTKVGDLRQYSNKPQEGRTYFVIFGNKERAVKQGAKVTVSIGDLRVEHLVVK